MVEWSECWTMENERQVAAAVLSKRYEEQLFSQGSRHSKVVPVLVITGFLGSGKTTLLQHLLATTGHELKLGVLVNEVASLDVDGQLLSTGQSNAAAGIKAAQLAGGCACCSVSSNLQAALQELASSSSYQQLDYLLLETSGVADVEPLAALLTSSGFKLAGVVTVVDAEAGSSQLDQEQVALAQLRAADVVVINKCDLSSLSGLSSVEDLVRDKAPGVRTLRARFGQVPAEALLDVDVAEGAESSAQDTGDATTTPQQQQGVQGEIAFLSHEPVVSMTQHKGTRRAGTCLITATRAAKAATAAATTAATGNTGEQHLSPHNSHSHSHSSFVSTSFSSDTPLCMACFQAYVANTLLTATGLFRAKGFVWFSQQRSLQYVFHVSGKQRAECGAVGRWQGQPGVQLVLIGQQQELLLELKQQLQQTVADCCYCVSGEGARTRAPTDTAANGLRDNDGERAVQQVQRAAGAAVAAGGAAQHQPPQLSGGCWEAATSFARLVQQHHRFELCQEATDPQPAQQQTQMLTAPGTPRETIAPNSGKTKRTVEASGLVHFSCQGSPLHGVIADEVNAAVLRRANAAAGLFLCHVRSPPALRAAAGSGHQVAYQGVVELQLCFKAHDTAEVAQQQWERLEDAVAPALRKAYQHVHNCQCDVVQLMTS